MCFSIFQTQGCSYTGFQDKLSRKTFSFHSYFTVNDRRDSTKENDITMMLLPKHDSTY